MTLKMYKQSKKPFYIKMNSFPFKKNHVICNSTTNKYIVINPKCKDAWWRKTLRWFGFKIFNPEGCIKVKPCLEK